MFSSICQMNLPDMTFVPYEPFDLDPFLKVTAAICKLTLPNLNCGTNLLGAGNHNVSAVLLFASLGSTNMHGFRSLWPQLRSQEVKIPPIGLHVFRVFFQIFPFLHQVQSWFLGQLRAFSDPHTTCHKLGQCDLYIQFYRPKFTSMYSSRKTISL